MGKVYKTLGDHLPMVGFDEFYIHTNPGETWPRSRGPSACSPTPLPSPRHGGGSTTSLISCMLRELLCIGMWERVWKKVNLVKLVKTWLHWRKIMKRLEWILWKERMGMNTEVTIIKFIYSLFRN